MMLDKFDNGCGKCSTRNDLAQHFLNTITHCRWIAFGRNGSSHSLSLYVNGETRGVNHVGNLLWDVRKTPL